MYSIMRRYNFYIYFRYNFLNSSATENRAVCIRGGGVKVAEYCICVGGSCFLKAVLCISALLVETWIGFGQFKHLPFTPSCCIQLFSSSCAFYLMSQAWTLVKRPSAWVHGFILWIIMSLWDDEDEVWRVVRMTKMLSFSLFFFSFFFCVWVYLQYCPQERVSCIFLNVINY